jgi:hypothetical protein
MKKILVVLFSVSMAISVIVIGNVSASAASIDAKGQVNYLKRKTKKVYRRTKNGTKDIAHETKHKTKKTYYRTKSGTKDVAHETKHKTKKGYYKSKRVTKKTYRKTKDKVTE